MIDGKVQDRVLIHRIGCDIVVLSLTAVLAFLFSRRVIRPLASLAEAVSRSGASLKDYHSQSPG